VTSVGQSSVLPSCNDYRLFLPHRFLAALSRIFFVFDSNCRLCSVASNLSTTDGLYHRAAFSLLYSGRLQIFHTFSLPSYHGLSISISFRLHSAESQLHGRLILQAVLSRLSSDRMIVQLKRFLLSISLGKCLQWSWVEVELTITCP